uniref:Uncharacterized protein n=1 Tax=Arabidopsis thaliana TaxID=3702 RepID=Q680Z2_ARATH|nr:unnamed protein product [Arabidopsis thaliana]
MISFGSNLLLHIIFRRGFNVKFDAILRCKTMHFISKPRLI